MLSAHANRTGKHGRGAPDQQAERQANARNDRHDLCENQHGFASAEANREARKAEIYHQQVAGAPDHAAEHGDRLKRRRAADQVHHEAERPDGQAEHEVEEQAIAGVVLLERHDCTPQG